MHPLEVEVPAAAAAVEDGAMLVDVRQPWEYDAGHAPGAVLVPLGSLAERAGELPRDRAIHLICASGNRSLVAAEALDRAGFDAVSVAGGMVAWRGSGRAVVTGTNAA